jgi:hypothetical protein
MQKDEYLPIALKAGSVWDRFMTGQELDKVADRYQLQDLDRAKINALARAYTDLEIQAKPGEMQVKVKFIILNNVVTGKVDKDIGDGFEEWKLSSYPDSYFKLTNIHQQCGTYLYSTPAWEYVDMMVTRYPQLKTGKGAKENESIEEYQERIYQDIISRPSYYFLGYNRTTHTFGKRFWRKEFDLAHIENSYRWGFQEIRDTIKRESWYGNKFSCDNPQPCQYLDICKTGGISETVYRYIDPNQYEKK